jgi:6-phosphogluconolactonase
MPEGLRNMPDNNGAKDVIKVYPDAESMSRAAAELVARRAAEAVEARGRFCAALSGGRTPRRAYELLATEPLTGRVDWKRVHIFWGDERCVPPDDPLSNERTARSALLDRVPIPPDHVHPIRCASSPGEAAARYADCIRAFFRGCAMSFDLVLLGLGENGHTASLFPGSAILNERSRLVAEVHLPGEEFARVTMTVPLINGARAAVFLVSGASKALMLRRVLEGAGDLPLLPAQLIRPLNGEVVWMVDRAAARLLEA